MPSAVVTMTEMRATWSVTPSADSSASLASSFGYHSSVKPRQAKLRLESLNENRMRMAIGENRNP